MRPISLGTRFGFGLAAGSGFCPPVDALTPFPAELAALGAVFPTGVTVAEPVLALSVVEVGPVAPPVVSDELTACVDEPDVLLFAADADFVPLPLHANAAVAIAIE